MHARTHARTHARSRTFTYILTRALFVRRLGPPPIRYSPAPRRNFLVLGHHPPPSLYLASRLASLPPSLMCPPTANIEFAPARTSPAVRDPPSAPPPPFLFAPPCLFLPAFAPPVPAHRTPRPPPRRHAKHSPRAPPANPTATTTSDAMGQAPPPTPPTPAPPPYRSRQSISKSSLSLND